MYLRFFSLTIFTFVAAHAAEPISESCINDLKSMRVGVRHIEGRGIGYTNGYTTLEAFLAAPPELWPVMPFMDVRGHVFDNGKLAANAGLGLRGLAWNRVFGTSIYYDYRNTKKQNYNQVSFGLETLGKWVDARVNGYFPVGTQISSPYNLQFDRFSGNSIFVSQKFQYALTGANGELGVHLPSYKDFNFYTAAGPYYLIGKIGTGIWGGEIRLNGNFKNYVTLEVSYSYDTTFKNIVQGQIGFNIPFGPKSREKKGDTRSCSQRNMLNTRMLQPVTKNEIIPTTSSTQESLAIDPATGQPYTILFVDNTSHSQGTYESPYPTFAQVEVNSSPNDIIYVFPGDGTTKGMDSGISLKATQKFWGSGISHSLQTSQGTISIPAQSNSSPIITNTNFDTDGNAITLATNNAISGFTITSALYDAIYGSDPQSLDLSSCTIENTTRFAVEAICSNDASISLTNNQFLTNINGVFLELDGTSTIVCSGNTFEGQTSSSEAPLKISADTNSFVIHIENNIFNDNTCGSILFNIHNVVDADINVVNNIITNNGTGSLDALGSSFVVASNGTIDNCSIILMSNTFSENTSNSLFMDTSGQITTLEVTASTNTMSNNGGSALVLATPVDTLTFFATDNTITGIHNNGIGIIGSGLTSTGTITINNNTITDVGNASNGIAINQDFTTLNLAILDNEINECEGTGIVSYTSGGINSLSSNISGNTINNCQNLGSNAASGISLDTYVNLTSTISNNTLSNNPNPCFAIGYFTAGNPNVCLTLTGNSSDTDPGYSLTNPGSGVFNLSPCNVSEVNTGTISGTVTLVQSCSNPTPCPP